MISPDTSSSRPKSLQQQAFDAISRQIVFCRLKPGEKFTINGLVSSMGMGRTPIREALVRLQEVGLVEAIPQVSTFVAKISIHDAESSCFVRESVSTRIATECCACWQPGDLDGAKEANARMHQAIQAGDKVSYFDADNAVHHQIYRIAGRERVYEWMSQIAIPLDRMRWLRLMTETVDTAAFVDEHEAILAAIEARDVNETGYLMTKHVHELLRDEQKIVDRFPDYFVE